METSESTVPNREEMRQICALSSRDFDSLYGQRMEKLQLRSVVAKGLVYFEDQLRNAMRQQSQDQQRQPEALDHRADSSVEENVASNNVETSATASQLAAIFRRLGHLHLIAQDYPKALSAYQRCYNFDKNCWQDADFLFGLGLVYFHFKEYTCVIEVFQKLLYVHPNFKRFGDVCVRLGLAFKGVENWSMAVKNLNAALIEQPPSISPLEIRFHIADCFDQQQGQSKKAKELYEGLLKLPDLTASLRASVLRHIGWLYFRSEELGEKATRLSLAVTHLQESLALDSINGKTHYYLGRCYSAMGRAHDAFVAYRHSIDKAESSADTWCSIGVLYQQQQQPMDALQAYVCAVQLDERHYAAWVDLGLLYEQCGQPEDALNCYMNAAKLRPADETLAKRINVISTQLKQHQTSRQQPTTNAKRGTITLPSLEEAWTLPIPAELTSRQDAAQSQKLLAYIRGSFVGIGVHDIYQQQQQRISQEAPSFASQLGGPPPSGPAMQAPAPTAPTGTSDFPQVSQEDLQAFLGDDRDIKYDPTLSGGTEKILQENEVASTTAGQGASPPPTLNLLARCCVPLSTTAQQLEVQCKLRFSPNYAPPVEERTAPPSADLPPLPHDQLIQPTPTVIIDSKKDAHAVELQMFCYQRDIAVLRNFASALRLDLGLFSTKTLMETAGDQQVEVRTQFLLPPDQNYTAAGDKRWYCGSTRSFTTVTKYAQYQAQSFQQSLREEQDKLKNGKSPDRDSSDHFNRNGNNAKRRREDTGSGLKMIKFGTNVDLSDDRRWKVQLQELQKLPPFCRVTSSVNLLSHLNHIVLGMNTVQLYMKVPGSRTPGHQENNNFSSVNINIGPGECEWFGVAYKYWPVVRDLCEKNHVDYLKGSWWPPLEDLLAANVPVYRFTQKPGDLVWISGGTVHWVQATGWCNNIAWNVGPVTLPQYDMAIERYEWNKLQGFKSIVPIVHLTWQLARNVKFSDPAFYERVKSVLLRSLVHCYQSMDYVSTKLERELRYQPREDGEPAHYCTICEVEVFNILYVTEQDRKFVVHCLHCALRIDSYLKSFTVLNQYTKEELAGVFDQFNLTQKRPGTIC